MAKQKFKVVREHVGDKPYAEGDIREAEAADVKHLVPNVLEPIAKAKPKAAAPTKGK